MNVTIRTKWLKNHGLTITRVSASGKRSSRFAGPAAMLTVSEAAAALKTNVMMLYRLRDRGGLRLVDLGGQVRVPMRELLRLKRAWKGGPPTSLTKRGAAA